MSKRAAIYLRVSTIEQAREGYGLDSQLRQCEAMAVVAGWDVVETYVDDGVSGTIPIEERTAGGAMMRAVRSGEIDVIIFAAFDRLARKATIIMNFAEELEGLGVDMASAKERIDTTTRSGRTFMGVLAVFAQNEKEVIVERLLEGRMAKAESGQIVAHGDALYGYRLVETDDGTQYEVDPATAEVVELIFEMYTKRGMSMRTICNWLTEKRAPTPGSHGRRDGDEESGSGRWYKTSVRRILTNEAYTGKWTYSLGGEETVEVEIPAIIDEATFERVQRVREANTNQPKHMKHDYLLAGYVRCGVCDKATANAFCVHGRGRTYLYYKCGASRQPTDYEHECGAKSWRADASDQVVWEWITRILQPGELEGMLEAAAEAQSGTIEALSRNLEELEKRIREREADLDRLVERRLYGDQLTVEAFKRREEQITTDVRRLRRERQDIEDELRSEWRPSSAERERLMHLSAMVHERELSFDEKRRVVAELELSARLVFEDDQQAVHVAIERPHREEVLLLP